MSEHIEQPRGGLIRQLILFAIVPTMFLIVGLIVYSSVATFSRERISAESNLKKLATKVALEAERKNNRANFIAQAIAISQVSGMFGNRAVTVDYLRGVLEKYPELTAAGVGYEPNADQNDLAFLRAPAGASDRPPTSGPC